MTVTDRVHAFAKLLGYNKPVFADVDDAQTFISMAKNNVVMKQFPLFLSHVEDGVSVGPEVNDLDHTSDSAKLTWNNLRKYTVDPITGVVNL